VINPGDQNYMNIGRQRSTEGQSRRAYKRQRDRFDRKQVKKGQKAWRRSRVEKRTIEQDAAAKLRVLANDTASPALKANARKGISDATYAKFIAAVESTHDKGTFEYVATDEELQ
jgi:hypothetical protein